MIHQVTLATPISARGIGLHSGEQVQLTLRPAPPNTGIVFRRMDANPPVEIPALAACVGDTQLSTTLEKDGWAVATVEHLLAALAGFGVDNAWIEVDHAEVPIMDGSASAFVFLLTSAGLQQQAAPKRFIRICKEVQVTDGDKVATFFPYNGFQIRFSIDFSNRILDASMCEAQVEFSTTSFVQEVCRARTFGFVHEIEYLHSRGLARGGNLDNAVVVDEYRILNPEGLRSSDEFVKHKILDAIGDLYLLGSSLIGGFSAHKSGHSLNNALLRELLRQPGDAWEEVSFDSPHDVPIRYDHAALAASAG